MQLVDMCAQCVRAVCRRGNGGDGAGVGDAGGGGGGGGATTTTKSSCLSSTHYE